MSEEERAQGPFEADGSEDWMRARVESRGVFLMLGRGLSVVWTAGGVR